MTLRQLSVFLLGAILLLFVAENRIKCKQHQQQQAQERNQQQDQLSNNHDLFVAAEAVEAATSSSKNGENNRQFVKRSPEVRELAGNAGYLLAQPTNRQLNRSNGIDSTLANILDRNGPDMRPLRDFRDFSDISVDVAKRAWQLMHDHALAAVIGRLSAIRPIVERALFAANVSSECILATNQTIEAAQRLDSWAIQLLTAWGNFPPTGIFEGTFGDIGSFHGCVNVPKNPVIDHAHYCTIAYRPILPVRKEYELIIRGEPNELLHLFDRKQENQHLFVGDGGKRFVDEDAFSELLRHAQYNHYVYYKFGTCFPIQCSPIDVKRIAKLLGKESMLMSGPVKCHSKFKDDYEEKFESLSNNSTSQIATMSKKLQISTRDLNDGVYIWKPHITRTQQVALIIILLVSLFIVSMTLIDIALVRLPRFYDILRERRRKLVTQLNNGDAPTKATSKYVQRSTVATCSGLQLVTSDSGLDAEYDPNNNMSLRQLNPPTIQTVDQLNYYDINSFKTISLNEDNDGSKRSNRQLNKHELSHRRQTSVSENYEDSTDEQLEIEEEKYEKVSGKANGKKVEEKQKNKKKHRSLLMEIVDDCSIITNIEQFFRVSQSQLNNDILCINGIRCITMSWIIITHTMQYNDWSAFARTREIETHFKSLINQPLFNGSYLVDTFFLVSGLLTSLSSFRNANKKQQRFSKNVEAEINGNRTEIKRSAEEGEGRGFRRSLLEKFSPCSYLIGRYLRLTPQIMLVSMLFILLPLLSKTGGPHWYTITGEYSENCSQNWWLSLFYIQAFYRSNEMCNFVCWWISVDMFYHLFALAVILLILYYGHKAAILSCSLIVLAHWTVQATKHYQLGLPPNLLSTIPQTGAMWSEMTLESFWTPYAHAFPFFLGLYLGYLMAEQHSTLAKWFNLKRASIGWFLATSLLVLQSYSTYFWVIGEWRYTRLVATLFYLICPIIWATCLSWIIVACQYGFGGFVNSMLSCKLFIVLGKASYIVYLSHFLVLFSFFGSQNLLLEPTQLVMMYVIIGNICLSMILGCCLCVVYEMPWLKAQKRIMKYVN